MKDEETQVVYLAGGSGHTADKKLSITLSLCYFQKSSERHTGSGGETG